MSEGEPSSIKHHRACTVRKLLPSRELDSECIKQSRSKRHTNKNPASGVNLGRYAFEKPHENV